MTIGGSKVIFSCQAQIKVLIAGVLTLFTDCQNSTLFRRYDRLNFWASILSLRPKKVDLMDSIRRQKVECDVRFLHVFFYFAYFS